jgi:hypothetical protein
MAPFKDDIVTTIRKANEELIERLQARLEVAEVTIKAIDEAHRGLKTPAQKRAAAPLREELHALLSSFF